MKTVSLLIPTYNEVGNVEELSSAIISEMKNMPQYDYEIVFIDNHSNDGTRNKLYEICSKNSKIKAILNARNFGPNKSLYYGLTQTSGDCTILMCADFQEPVEMIPEMIREWENGYKIVTPIKTASKENKVMYFIRTCYYKMIKKFSEVEQIEHFTGFGLYDKTFIQILKDLKDPTPFLRGIVAELGYKRKEIPYTQQKRKSGKSKCNFYVLYDIAMLSFTSYTKIGLRMATFLGFAIAVLSVIVAIVYFVLKLLHWNSFAMGTAPILIGMFLLGAVQLIFLGLLGEHILSINARIMNRPLVIEEERLNFPENSRRLE